MLTEQDIGKEVTITDKIKRVTFYNRGTGYCVVSLENTKSMLNGVESPLKVCARFNELIVDSAIDLEKLTYSFQGNVVKNQYGIQIECKNASLQSSRGFFILTRYVKKVGEKLANQILSEFSSAELMRMLETDKLEPLLKVKGVSKKTIANIREGYSKNTDVIQFEYLFREKYNLILTSHQIAKIKDTYKTPLHCSEVLENEPYTLLKIPGFGFKTVDEMLLRSTLVPDKTSELRLRFGTLYWFETQASTNGDTLVPINKALYGESSRKIDGIVELLGVDEEYILKTIEKLKAENKLHTRKVKDSEDEEVEVIGLTKYLIYENDIRKSLSPQTTYFNNMFVVSDEARNKFLAKFEKEHNITFNAQQREFIKLATSGHTRISLVGYAGTGKTTVCSAVVDLLKSQLKQDFNDNCVVSCAFTGVAAERIGSVAQCETKTIHRLLGFNPRGNDQTKPSSQNKSEDGESDSTEVKDKQDKEKRKFDYDSVFSFNASNKLQQKVVLLDESSMIDIELYRALVRAIPTSTLFVTIGDPAQLPPIGAGNVFSDIIKQKIIPSVELTEIYRQSKDSVLTQFAEHIRHGNEHFINSENIGFTDYKDFSFTHRQYSKEYSDEFNHTVLNLVLKQVSDLIDNGIDKDDIQVLSPQHTTVVGCTKLNEELQKYFVDVTSSEKLTVTQTVKKDDKEYTISKDLFIGERLIHLRNQDMPVSDYDMNGKLLRHDVARIFNGYIGKIVKINNSNQTFIVDYTIKDDGSMIHRQVEYDVSKLRDKTIDYAYAMTIHKSQGSQYKHVIIPIVPAHIYQLNNQLLYTAVTRAKDKVYLIGTTYAFRRGITNTSVSQRLTNLSLGDNFAQSLAKRDAAKRLSQPRNDLVDDVNEFDNASTQIDDAPQETPPTPPPVRRRFKFH